MSNARVLDDAPWLRSGPAARVLELLNGNGEEARVVGGAVRNALLKIPTGDIDIATTAVPDEVIRRAKAAGIKSVPTGIEHGTVTLVVDARPFEVTTLREDTETFGRKAKVAFGRDWVRCCSWRSVLFCWRIFPAPRRTRPTFPPMSRTASSSPELKNERRARARRRALAQIRPSRPRALIAQRPGRGSACDRRRGSQRAVEDSDRRYRYRDHRGAR